MILLLSLQGNILFSGVIGRGAAETVQGAMVTSTLTVAVNSGFTG